MFFLDFVHDVTDIQILKHYVSGAGSTSVFKQKALKLFHPLDQAILGHCVKTDRRFLPEDGCRAGFRSAVIQCLYIYIYISLKIMGKVQEKKTVPVC
jgi:hypothetical protein